MLNEIKGEEGLDLDTFDPIANDDDLNAGKNVYSDDEYVFDAYGEEAENQRGK